MEKAHHITLVTHPSYLKDAFKQLQFVDTHILYSFYVVDIGKNIFALQAASLQLQ